VVEVLVWNSKRVVFGKQQLGGEDRFVDVRDRLLDPGALACGRPRR